MSAISTARHKAFMQQLERWSIVYGQQPFLQEDLQRLGQIYDQYQLKLSAIRRLIRGYDLVQRRVKTALKQQQLKQTRQKIAVLDMTTGS